MPLAPQIITVPLTGLQTKADPKSAPVGVLTVAENCWASRRTAGGIELRKRYGFTAKTKSIQGGGTITTGRTLGVLNDEVVLCDALKAYSYSAVLDKWLGRGRAQNISCDIRTISGDQGAKKPNVCSAYAGGYSVHVSSPQSSTGLTTVYVKDTTTGDVLAASSSLSFIYRARVVALGGDFYIFSWNGTNNIECQKISGSSPTTLPSSVTVVASNASTNGVFDVVVDATNGQMVVIYENTTPTTTLKVWTTGMTAGTTVAYASFDPVGSAGFLLNANGTLAIDSGNAFVAVASLTEVRVLKFGATNMTVSGNDLYETTGATDFPQITGYRAGTTNNVFWTSGTGMNSKIRGGSKADAGSVNLFDVMLSIGLASKPFQVGSLWYLIAAYQTSGTEFSTNPSQYGQRRTFMLELTENTTGANGAIGLAGYLMANDSGGLPRSRACLPAVSIVSAGRIIFGSAGLSSVAPVESTAQVSHWKLMELELDWSGKGLGKPVVYGGVLHIPGAAPRIYDGHFLVEQGLWVLPEAPNENAQATGGSLELLGSYDYVVVFAKKDKAGRRWRSAAGPVTTVTLTGSNTKVTLDLKTLGVTENCAKYNSNAEVSAVELEIYRTEANLPNFYLCGIVPNNPLVNTVSFEDILSDDQLTANDILYETAGNVGHVYPPAVKVFHRHAERLFAITGDQAIWHTNTLVEETGAEFSDDFRFTIEQGEGPPVALATVDATLAIFKKDRTLLLSGAGPDSKGNGDYPTPQALQDDLGADAVAGAGSPAAVMPVSGGILVRTGKSWWLLGRDLAYSPIEPPAGFDALTPGFGAPLGGGPGNGRPMAVIPTDGVALVYDWQMQQFFTWTGAASFLAGVCAVRWRGALLVLKSDGTVLQEVVGQWFDGSSTAIDMTAEIAWLELNNARVWQALVTIEAKATTNVTTTFYENRDDSVGNAQVTAVTTARKDPLVHSPVGGDCGQGKLRIFESSATEGIWVSKLDLEVGQRSGARKFRTSTYAT